LWQAQRLSILTGDNHYLQFTISNGLAAGYQIMRRSANGVTTPADSYRPFPPQVSVTVSQAQMEFTFEGQALAAYELTLSGANRAWRVSVTPITGAVRVSEI
jgi:hypothetical protein